MLHTFSSTRNWSGLIFHICCLCASSQQQDPQIHSRWESGECVTMQWHGIIHVVTRTKAPSPYVDKSHAHGRNSNNYYIKDASTNWRKMMSCMLSHSVMWGGYLFAHIHINALISFSERSQIWGFNSIKLRHLTTFPIICFFFVPNQYSAENHNPPDARHDISFNVTSCVLWAILVNEYYPYIHTHSNDNHTHTLYHSSISHTHTTTHSIARYDQTAGENDLELTTNTCAMAHWLVCA